MRFSLRQVQVFLAVAHYGNMTKAADSLAMSQSAASSALKEIELQFDIKLFDRVGKRLKINAQGEKVRQYALDLIEQADNFERAMTSDNKLGNLHIGATLTIGNYLAVDMVAEFMRNHPESHVDLTVSNTEHVLAQLINYEVDIALVEGELNHPDVRVERWFDDKLCVVASPDNPIAKKTAITDADLMAQKWIVRESGSGTRQGFERAMHGIVSDLDILLELEHTEAIKKAVRSNLGVTCVSEIAVEEEVAEGKLVKIDVGGRDLIRGFYWLTHKKRALSPAAICFVDEFVMPRVQLR